MARTHRNMQERLPEQVLNELAAIGLTRATDVISTENGTVELKSPAQLGKIHGAAIASVEKSTGGWKIKFYDKLKALELLGTYLGMSGSGAKNGEEAQSDLLKAVILTTGRMMDTSDIQELQQTADVGNDMVEPSPVSGM